MINKEMRLWGCALALLMAAEAPAHASVKLSGAMVAGGDVTTNIVSPDGAYVVYRADQDVDEKYELFSVPFGGGTPTKLNGPMVAGGDVSLIRISADSSRVVYTADQDADDVVELYSVPIGGGTPTKLNAALVANGDVRNLSLSEATGRAVYLADQDTDTVDELYSVPIEGGAVTKLNGTLVANGDVNGGQYIAFFISDDGARVVYKADQSIDSVFELYSVPITGGAATKLHSNLPAGRSVQGFSVSPDSSRVIYVGDLNTNDVDELYSVPITGGTPIKLSGTMTNGGDVYLATAHSDNVHVLYLADQTTNEVMELYSVPIAGGTAVKLNGALVAGGIVAGSVFQSGYTGSYELYYADQDTNDVDELYSVPIGGGTAIKLNAPLVAGGDVYHAQPSYSAARVAYLADQDSDEKYELYSVPIAGGSAIKLNAPLVANGNLQFVILNNDGMRAIYTADQDVDEAIEIYSVPIAGGTVTKLNGPLVPGGTVSTFSIRVAPDDSAIVYLAEQDTDGVIELYRADLGPVCGDGVVETGEACEAPFADCCDASTCQFKSAGTACASDASACTIDACDGAGVCGHGIPTGCGAAAKSTFTSKEGSQDEKDSFAWNWTKGAATDKATDLADPTASSSYRLCVFGGSSVIAEVSVPAAGTCGGKPCWKESSKGYKFKDKAGSHEGLTDINLTGGEAGKAKIKVKGKGLNLNDFTRPMATPVTVQLHNDATGACWSSTFESFVVNDDEQAKFKDEEP